MTATSLAPERSSWRPSAEFTTLVRRAATLRTIRAYFEESGVLEVETPLLARFSVTDPAIHGIEVRVATPGIDLDAESWFLQTSPEYAMKRLLATGSGSIYQVTKAVRAGECGRRHTPEFTLLEWYRVGIDHHALMDDVAQLLARLLGPVRCHRRGYRAVFRDRTGADPITAGDDELRSCAERLVPGLDPAANYDRALWLDLIFSHVLSPSLGLAGPEFVYDYPMAQAALARRSPDDAECAARFELFINGMEIANGYHELTDPIEQRARFAADNERRQALGLPERAPDSRLIAALDHGLPDCAGVALGLDRLLMVMLKKERIDDVLAFASARA